MTKQPTPAEILARVQRVMPDAKLRQFKQKVPPLEPGQRFAVYFVHADGEAVLVRDGKATAKEEAPCRCCGRCKWWLSILGAIVCGHCHPPAAPALVARWITAAEPEPPPKTSGE